MLVCDIGGGVLLSVYAWVCYVYVSLKNISFPREGNGELQCWLLSPAEEVFT